VKVKVLRGFCLETGRDVFPGEEIDMEKAKALVEINKGRVKPLEDARERVVEDRDPKTHRR